MKSILALSFFLILNVIHAQIDSEVLKKSYYEKTSDSHYDSIVKSLGYKKGDRLIVYAIFSIDQNKKIGDVRTRGPHPYFEEVAKNILLNTPGLVPENYKLNKEEEKPLFSIPIEFIIETEKQRKKIRRRLRNN